MLKATPGFILVIHIILYLIKPFVDVLDTFLAVYLHKIFRSILPASFDTLNVTFSSGKLWGMGRVRKYYRAIISILYCIQLLILADVSSN